MILGVYFKYYLNLRSANRNEVTEWMSKDSGSCDTPFYYFYRVRLDLPLNEGGGDVAVHAFCRLCPSTRIYILYCYWLFYW